MKRGSNSNDTKCACYTSPLAPMSASFAKNILLTSLLISILSASATAQEAQNPFTQQATQIVTDIMNRTGSPGFVTLDVQNRSTLSATDLALARKAIENQLRGSNVRLVKPERAVAEITVIISENLQGILWVAEIKQGLATQTLMLQGGKPAVSTAPHTPMLTVKRTLIFVQGDATPIIDFALLDANTLLLLEPERLATYSASGDRWNLRNSFPIHHSQPWPRDLRGHLLLQSAQLTSFMPGVQCNGTISANAVTNLNCAETDDPWQLDASTNAFFPASRNFFSGIIRGLDVSLPPFYSMSTVGDTNPVSIFSGTDGRVRLYFSFTQAPHVYSGWGSDIAAVQSACGSGWQVLVSRPGDRTQPDALQAMEIVNREPVPVSASLDVPGVIMSMWRSADGKTANLVTQDLESKKYEASLLSIDCH